MKHGPWGRHGTVYGTARRTPSGRPAPSLSSFTQVPRRPPAIYCHVEKQRAARSATALRRSALSTPGARTTTAGKASRLGGRLSTSSPPAVSSQPTPTPASHLLPPRGTAVPIRRREARRRLTSTIHHQNWQLMDAYQAASGCRRRCRCCCCVAGVSVLPPGSSWAAAAAAAAAAGRSSERRSG